jgi:hypothetical protein
MRSLPSSAGPRLEALRQRLVLDLYMKRGAFWDRVRDIRTRWEVNAVRAIPPANPTEPDGIHLPDDCPPRPDWEKILRDPMCEEAWSAFVQRWHLELVDLHDAVIPHDYRYREGTELEWEAFLSACVLFDPPVPGLEEFARASAGPLRLDVPPNRQGKRPRYVMQQSPIVYLRDAERAERATEALYLGAIEDLIEKYVKPAGHDPQKVLNDVLFDSPQALERREKWAKASSEDANPVRPYVDVRRHTTEQDVRGAWQMIRAGQERLAKDGRPRRGLLRDVECAILHDSHGWTYEHIAEHYGWLDHTRVSKHVRAGREALAK